MTNRFNIMIVEDHAGYRKTLVRTLNRAKNIGHISEFSTAELALSTLEEMGAHEIPNFVLLDLNLPGMSGIQSIPWFKEFSSNLKIIILTQSSVEEDILQAIRLGASGYLLKSATAEQIIEAIYTVMEGGASLDPKVAKFILKQISLPANKKQSLKKPLSDRELEVLTLLAEGKVRKEISDALRISVYTVTYHVEHIYQKLNVLNAPAAINAAFRKGILPVDS